ncbi:MAG TPA: porin family protein [Telluria sp.]|nr:porin family protein [Telluria sp.]
MKKLIIALIAGASAMGAAQAQGPYVGVGIATANHNDNIPGSSSGNWDGYKASGKLFGGYEFDQMWGLEAGYTDFRNSHGSYTFNNTVGSAESDGHAFYLAAKANAPINDQFSVFGKLGAVRTKSSLSTGIAALDHDDSNTGLYAGIGGQYNLNKKVALTLEYERYGKSTDFGAKPDVWTLGARYSF